LAQPLPLISLTQAPVGLRSFSPLSESGIALNRQHRIVRASLVLAVLALIEWPAAIFAQDRPGIKAKIIGVTIPAHRRPVVTFKIADSKGQPLEQSDLDEDGIRFTVATIKAGANGETHYHNYILGKVTGKDYVYKGETKKPVLEEASQPGFDRGGVLARLGPGTFTYTFKTPLPANYERNATQVVGGELTRGKTRYVANPLYEFVPSGDKIRIRRTVVETASCNNCHDPLTYHGGTSREAGYCALCHTSQLTDLESGENLEFKVFVHKIHRGKLLPSVKDGKPFFIVGAGQHVAHYTKLRYTQVVTTEGTTKDLRNCKACHANANGQKDNWKQFPRSEGKKLYQTYCIACHGASGKGDGPAAKTLPVKPADHTRANVMNQHTDQYLFEVISKGGASVGKSAQMPAWGAVLKEAQIQEVVGYIRTLTSAQKDTARLSGGAK
jgi:OmcA/MtrC family decaheme c-type cytochrome